jgi:cytochrome c oxidase subunit 2
MWRWDYEYPDNGEIAFTANLVADDQLKPGEPRLLSTDYKVVVPVGKIVRMIVTSNDVIHAWAIPSFGVKIDAVPGRLNETWFKAEREGIYYGQCSELCGQGHAYMPIEVHAVSEELFDRWAEAAARDPDEAAKLLAAADAEPLTVAAVSPAHASR